MKFELAQANANDGPLSMVALGHLIDQVLYWYNRRLRPGSPQIRQRQYWLAARRADASEIQRQLQSRGRETAVRRQESIGNSRPSPAAERNAGYWSDAVFHDCADGFARPVGPGIGTVVDRSPAGLESLRGYGNACNAELAIAFADAALEALAEFNP